MGRGKGEKRGGEETGCGKLCGIMGIISFADDKMYGKRLARVVTRARNMD